MGWGTRDLNEVMTWGSGFIDTWSNPANQPSQPNVEFEDRQGATR